MNPIPVYKMSELIHWANVLRIAVPGRYDEAHAKTADLARELFPVRAKPLVWDEEPPPFDEGRLYSYGSFCGKTLYQCGITLFDGTHYGHFRSGGEFFYGTTRAEVKAACEAHNQARFLEQLA